MSNIEHENPGSGGGWISGPMIDPRPEFSPAALTWEVVDVLARHGITINPAPGQLHVASLAFADGLRALGVRPATAPERRS